MLYLLQTHFSRKWCIFIKCHKILSNIGPSSQCYQTIQEFIHTKILKQLPLMSLFGSLNLLRAIKNLILQFTKNYLTVILQEAANQ